MLYSLTTCFLKNKKESPANPLVYWTFWRRVRDSNPCAIARKLISRGNFKVKSRYISMKPFICKPQKAFILLPFL